MRLGRWEVGEEGVFALLPKLIQLHCYYFYRWWRRCRWSLMKPVQDWQPGGPQLGGASWGSLGDLLPVGLRAGR